MQRSKRNMAWLFAIVVLFGFKIFFMKQAPATLGDAPALRKSAATSFSLEGPPTSPTMFMVWIGPPELPHMYQVALASAVKCYGRSNITIVSQSLLPAKDWYPRIWNVSAAEIALQLTDLHPTAVWNDFLETSGKLRAHTADFLRVALVYLYGGLYSDFDSIWIRPASIQFPYTAENGLEIHAFQAQNLNTVMGAEAGHRYYRYILEMMPSAYNARCWTCIGENLNIKARSRCNCTSEIYLEDEKKMLGINWRHARGFFENPMSGAAEALLTRVLNESYQLHLYGHMTQTANGTIPAKDSLYAKVLEHLSINFEPGKVDLVA